MQLENSVSVGSGGSITNGCGGETIFEPSGSSRYDIKAHYVTPAKLVLDLIGDGSL